MKFGSRLYVFPQRVAGHLTPVLSQVFPDIKGQHVEHILPMDRAEYVTQVSCIIYKKFFAYEVSS